MYGHGSKHGDLDQFARMQPVLAYVAAHLDEDIPLHELSRHAGISEFHLHRLFSAAVGETPKGLGLRLRLGRAAVLLLTSGDSVLDIALSSGFEDHAVFTRAFRRQFKLSPREYRQRGFASPVDAAQASAHAQLVMEVAPCVGVYRIQNKAEGHVEYTIEKKMLEPQPVLIARRRIKASEIAATITELLPKIFIYSQQHGIALSGHPLSRYPEFGIGMLTIEPAMRIVGAPPASYEGTGEVMVDTLPGGPAAVTVHVGPYDGLREAYAALEQWISREGHKPSGAPWESYVTDPGQVPNPAEWKTEVFWPIEE